MSRNYPAEQVEHAFNSKRLKNWQVPAMDKNDRVMTSTGTRFGTLQPRTGRTQFIAGDNGHLNPGMPKVPGSSFNHPPNVPVFMDTAPRWPQENPTWPKTLKATMGYKGIETEYLPASTVTLNAVDLKGTKERNYNFL